MLKENLKVFLSSYNVPLEKWGAGEAKTVDHLCAELLLGESILEVRGGVLTRVAEGSTLHVYHHDGENLWLLIEDKQIFKDGRERVRELETSIGEKMKRGEDSTEAAYRALSEELGIKERLPLFPKPNILKGPIPSVSFPGIQSVYVMYVSDVFIPPHLYKKEGYVEHQADKSSYFVWKKV